MVGEFMVMSTLGAGKRALLMREPTGVPPLAHQRNDPPAAPDVDPVADPPIDTPAEARARESSPAALLFASR